MNRLRASRPAMIAVLMILVLLAGALPAAGKGLPQDQPDIAPVPHTVLPGVETLTILWETAAPARGTVLYGLAPGALSQMAFEPPETRTSHSVTLQGLPSGSAVYYLIGSGGAPVGKAGQPFMAMTNAAPIEEPAAAPAQAGPAAPTPHQEAGWGVAFVVPANWTRAPIEVEGEGAGAGGILQLAGPGGALTIDRLPNPQRLSPQEWLDAHAADWDAALRQTLGAPQAGGREALVVGVAESCRSAPTLAAWIADGDFMFELILAVDAGRDEAPEFAALLASWSFGPQPAEAPADPALARIPASPNGLECAAPVQPAGIQEAPAPCPGAPMIIPTAGPNTQPWGCFGSRVFEDRCWPYDAVSPRGSYFRLPHRGVDLGGETGVSPVYATYSGTVYKYRDNNILLRFDGPFAGKSAWMAHMASYDGRVDYRHVTNGQRVERGQFIGYVGYRITDGPPHLHISYNNSIYGTESWPSINPTAMLAATNIVYHEDWDAVVPPTCTATSADSYEPDNFTNLAAVATTDGAPQRHDFHAPGDDDLIRFSAVAGRTYLIRTFDLDSGNDTQISVLNSTGATVLAENDDAASDTFASSLLFTPTWTGTFHVRVRHYSYRGYLPLRPQPTFTFPVYGPGTGYSFSIVEMLPNVLAGRPAYATSYDSVQGLKASYAIDADLGTHWASQPGLPPTQWWWGETGNKYYNTVTIRWEAQHAGRYFVGWSANNITFSGYYFTVDGPGWYAHDLGALRSSRYVGIRMEELAPGSTQYAMSEVEAYRRTGPLITGADGEPAEQPIELEPDSPEITITFEGEQLNHSVYLPGVGR